MMPDNEETITLSEDAFKKRFEKAFQIDPSLTSSELYTFLKQTDFVTLEAYKLVTERKNSTQAFNIPQHLLSQPSPPTQPATPSFQEVIDISSDNSPISKSSLPTRKRKKAFSTPKAKLSSPNESSDDDIDIRPRKRISPNKRRTVPAKPVEFSDEEDDSPISVSAACDSAEDAGSEEDVSGSSLVQSFDDELHVEPFYGNSKALSDGLSDEEPSDEEFSAANPILALPIPLRPKVALKKTSGRRSDDYVLKSRVETKSTPWMIQLAGTLFNRNLEAADKENLNASEKTDIIDLTTTEQTLPHLDADEAASDYNPSFIGSPIGWDSRGSRAYYSSVVVNGITYHMGGFCLVRPDGEYDAQHKAKKGRNRKRNDQKPVTEPWFARIISLFKDEIDGVEGAHLQWFVHGSKTFLEETAGPREIFEQVLCDDNNFGCFIRPIHVDHVDSSKDDYTSGVAEKRYSGQEYFYRSIYSDSEVSFTKSSAPDETPLTGDNCPCCHKIQEKEVFMREVVIQGPNIGTISAFERMGIKYYVNDFIYITPSRGGRFYIGQILEMTSARNPRTSTKDETNDIRVEVRLFDRCDDSHRKWSDEINNQENISVRDNRALYLSKTELTVSADRIMGKCEVKHIDDIEDLDQYKDQKDSFWVKYKDSQTSSGSPEFIPINSRSIYPSAETQKETADRNEALAQFHRTTKPLDAMELFAGCGGLSLGLHNSGAIRSKWAVEITEAAAETYKLNFPDAIVYHEDAVQCLHRALLEFRGEDTSTFRDASGKLITSKMPLRQQVEMLIAGFPCQGVSSKNCNRICDDLRNTLMVLVLGFVDFERPPYVLLENVLGLLDHPLGAKQDGKLLEGGIEKGHIKFLLRALTSLGYACQFTTLQAGEYSIPQSRQRVFIWASLGQLPKYPQPTSMWHGACPESFHRIYPARPKTSAPNDPVTIGDTLTDLPAFEYEDPQNILGRSEKKRIERHERSKMVQQIRVVEGMAFVGSKKQRYASRPLSEYQRRMRRLVRTKEVRYHVTMARPDRPTPYKQFYYRSAEIERICNIPLKRYADHRSLPAELHSWWLTAPASQAKKNKYYPGKYGRLDMDDSFPICLTNLDPSRNSWTLHPWQHRTWSVVEWARAQSFPDSFRWPEVDVDLIYRMIGNAVPPVLAEELGRELVELRLWEFLEAREQGLVQEKGSSRAMIETINLISDDEEQA